MVYRTDPGRPSIVAERVLTRAEAVRQRARWRAEGVTVALTNGCFDLLHVGHVRYLTIARRFGRLIVGVNSDASVRRLKGPARPILPEAERAEVVSALRCVDAVVIFDEATAGALLAELQPDVYVKGADYGPGGKDLPEAELAARIGTRVELVSLVPGRSTTSIVEAIRRPS